MSSSSSSLSGLVIQSSGVVFSNLEIESLLYLLLKHCYILLFCTLTIIIICDLSRSEGALDRLVGLLSESDAVLQIESVWCIANITAGEHEATLRVAKATAPYMITYLSGDNQNLQVCQRFSSKTECNNNNIHEQASPTCHWLHWLWRLFAGTVSAFWYSIMWLAIAVIKVLTAGA